MPAETKKCQNCKQSFIIEPDDFSFYEKIKVPPPTFCPECRMQRRLAWRNESNLHFRECDATKKKIISIYSTENEFPVYEKEFWWSDKWDQMASGRKFDFSRSFFEQFRELSSKAPRLNLLQTNVIKGEYSNYLVDSKNAYMVFSGVEQENTMYCIGSVIKTRDSVDIHLSLKIENSYWLTECNNCSNLKFSRYCTDCIDSSFLIDCRNCQSCFGCVGLVNGKYCIYNKQYNKEEYRKIISEYDLGSFSALIDVKKKVENFALSQPFCFARILKSENCIGDDIQNSKNCKNCFYLRSEVENVKNSYRVFDKVKDGADLNLIWDNVEIAYECLSVDKGYKAFFSSSCWPGQNIWYSDNCFNSRNIFGCIGLKNAEYCILNKQYSKEEYEKEVPKIIEQMKKIPFIDKKGREYRFGEFFPIELSPFPYNESLTQQYFPLTESQIKEFGYKYFQQEERNYEITMKTEDIPDNIKDVGEDIVKEIIECAHQSNCQENCQKAFRIHPDEFIFYKKHGISLPRLCLNCRHQSRVRERNPLKLWHRTCMCDKTGHDHTGKCHNEFETSYAPERPEIVYCKSCYQKEVY